MALIFRPPPRVVLKAAPSKLEQVVDRLAPKMQRAFREAALRAQGRIDLEVLAANVEAGRVGRAINQLKLETFVAEDLAPTMEFLVEANEAGRELDRVQKGQKLNEKIGIDLLSSQRKDGNEHAIVTDRDGTPLSRVAGQSSSVDVSHPKASRPGSDLHFHHNHPDNGPLSLQDVQALTTEANQGVKGITAYTRDRVYTIERIDDVSTGELRRRAAEIFEGKARAVKERFLGKGPEALLEYQEAQKEAARESIKILAQEGKISYKERSSTPSMRMAAETDIQGVLLDFKTTNPRALASAEAQAARLLTAVNEETKQTVRDLIARAYREQITTKDTARLIRDVVGLNDRQATALFNYRAGLVEDGRAADQVERMTARYGDRLLRDRAKTIAQTEVHRASAEGQHELWREGVREGRIDPTTARRIWIANVGSCPWCSEIEEINSDGVPIDGSFETPDGDFISGPEESHVGCFPGDVRVLAFEQCGATKRWYDGEMLVIRTAGGQDLRVTPNHPILTDGGWRAATLLNKGSYVVRHVGREWAVGTQDYNYEVPSSIEQIAETFLSSGQVSSEKVKTSSKDFHGDGAYSQVAIVGTNCHLRTSDNPEGKEHFSEIDFFRADVDADSPAALFTSNGLLNSLGVRNDAPDGRSVGCSDLVSACIGTHAIPLQCLGLALATQRNSGGMETMSDDRSASVESLREGEGRLPGSVERNNVRGINSNGRKTADVFLLSEHDTGPLEPRVDRMPSQSEFFSQIRNPLSGQITLDQVLELRRVHFAGHVYNLETQAGWYVAEGIIAHNCRCSTGLDMERE